MTQQIELRMFKSVNDYDYKLQFRFVNDMLDAKFSSFVASEWEYVPYVLEGLEE